MAAEVEQPDATMPQPAASRVVVTFPGPGSSEASVKAENVSLGQLMVAAYLLDCVTREARTGQLTQQALGSVIPAPADAIAQLRRAGRL